MFLPAIVPWVTSFIALTFSTNVLCTGKPNRSHSSSEHWLTERLAALIVIRILSIQRSVSGMSASSPQVNFSLRAIVIITESAALYSASVISLLISYSLNSNGQYTVLDLVSSTSHKRYRERASYLGYSSLLRHRHSSGSSSLLSSFEQLWCRTRSRCIHPLRELLDPILRGMGQG